MLAVTHGMYTAPVIDQASYDTTVDADFPSCQLLSVEGSKPRMNELFQRCIVIYRIVCGVHFNSHSGMYFSSTTCV